MTPDSNTPPTPPRSTAEIEAESLPVALLLRHQAERAMRLSLEALDAIPPLVERLRALAVEHAASREAEFQRVLSKMLRTSFVPPSRLVSPEDSDREGRDADE